MQKKSVAFNCLQIECDCKMYSLVVFELWTFFRYNKPWLFGCSALTVSFLWIYLYALFYNESFKVAMYEGSHRATELKKKSKQIFEHFIRTYSHFHPEIMWEQWETVACSFLPSLSIFGILLLKLSCDFIFPTICAHLKPQQETIWNMKLNDLTLFLVLTLIPLLQNEKCHSLDWPFSSPFTALAPHRRSCGGRTCVCISAYDFRSCSNLPGVS